MQTTHESKSKTLPEAATGPTDSLKDIYVCQDHREYLSAYLATKKNGQGLRALARKAGFKSPGHLSLLIQGDRNFTARSADLLAKALALKGRKRKLFLAFAKLDTVRSEAEREATREEILRLRSVREEFLMSSKQYSFLAIWYYPIVYAMIENNPHETSAEYLAKHLGRKLAAADVSQALEDMVDIELLEKGAGGSYRTRHTSITTPGEVRDLAAMKYHRNTLDLAHEALALPLDQREFGGLTAALPKHLLPVVKEKLRALRSELNELLSQETQPADIYQLNIQLFPLTTDIEGSSK